MASSCEKLDQLVKDYLLFRGFSATLKTLEQELKTDKDKGLRVDRMMEQIWTLVSTYDLPGLKEYWKYLNQRLFARLEQRYIPSVRKLESSLLKLYVVNAHQSGRQDKVKAFFETLGPELQTNPDFKEWFAFPFIISPAENPAFSLYFQKQWQDTLQLSLHNFLSVVLQAMPVPTLLNVEFDARRMKTLQEENMSLKQQLMNASSTNPSIVVKESRANSRRSIQAEMNPPSSPPDMVYDFSGLSNDSESAQEKQKSTRRFPLSLTSPLSGRKKSDTVQPKGKHASAPSGASAQAGSTSNSSLLTKAIKVTEMSVFPPPTVTQPPMSRDGRRSVTSASSSSGSTVLSTSVNRSTSLIRPASSPVPTRHSPTPQSRQQGIGSGDLGASSQGHPVTLRSTSVQENRQSKIRPSGRQFSESNIETSQQLDRVTIPTSQEPGGLGSRPNAASVDSESNLLFSADSPFLTLEDEYKEHSSAASFCRFSVAGQYVASLDVDGIVKVWMWSPQPATQATIMSKSAFLSLAWVSKSDRWLLLGNKTGTIRLFDVNESKTFREVLVQPDTPADCMRVTDLSINPSNSQFVCATSNLCPFTSNLNSVTGRLLQWDLRSLKLERALMVDSTVCTAITTSCFSHDGKLLLTGGADGCVRVYDSGQQKPIMRWQAHDNPIHSVQFRGESSIFTMAADGKLTEWSPAKAGKVLNSLSQGQCQLSKMAAGGCRGRLFALDFEGQYLLTYSGRQGVLYKVSSGSFEKVMELKPHLAPVVAVDWSPSLDTKVCLTGSSDGRVKISTLLTK